MYIAARPSFADPRTTTVRRQRQRIITGQPKPGARHHRSNGSVVVVVREGNPCRRRHVLPPVGRPAQRAHYSAHGPVWRGRAVPVQRSVSAVRSLPSVRFRFISCATVRSFFYLHSRYGYRRVIIHVKAYNLPKVFPVIFLNFISVHTIRAIFF